PTTPTELLRQADITMYRAKAGGRDCYRVFTEAMDADVQRRDQLEANLRSELQAGVGPLLHYQPIIGQRGDVIGVEGLMRWSQPDLGPIAPVEIIPIAEECGLMDELGRQTMIHACAAARRWPDLAVAVNLSPIQFRSEGFAHKLKALV